MINFTVETLRERLNHSITESYLNEKKISLNFSCVPVSARLQNFHLQSLRMQWKYHHSVDKAYLELTNLETYAIIIDELLRK